MPNKNTKYKLSVILVTYNHEKYVRQALQSLFDQEFNEIIELVVADDGSTDRTLEIIREFEAIDPRFFLKFLDCCSNLGITKNYQRAFAACSGKYIAILEGDDYWISPTKIKQQFNFLESHWECSLCSVNYFVYEEGKCRFTPRTWIGSGHRLISAKDLIADNLVGNFSTCMYRLSSLSKLPKKLFEIQSYDWIVNICIARTAFIGFLNEPMSVYRLHSTGAWTQMSQLEKIKTQLELIPAYNELTGYVFKEDFEILSHRLRKIILVPNIVNHSKNKFQGIAKTFVGILDYMPPILRILANAITPPKLKRFVVKILQEKLAS